MVYGNVGSSGKAMLTTIAVNTSATAVLKITFVNNGVGTTLELWAGSIAEYQGGVGTLQLGISGGADYPSLVITDTQKIANMHIYVLRTQGSAVSNFNISIE